MATHQHSVPSGPSVQQADNSAQQMTIQQAGQSAQQDPHSQTVDAAILGVAQALSSDAAQQIRALREQQTQRPFQSFVNNNLPQQQPQVRENMRSSLSVILSPTQIVKPPCNSRTIDYWFNRTLTVKTIPDRQGNPPQSKRKRSAAISSDSEPSDKESDLNLAILANKSQIAPNNDTDLHVRVTPSSSTSDTNQPVNQPQTPMITRSYGHLSDLSLPRSPRHIFQALMSEVDHILTSTLLPNIAANTATLPPPTAVIVNHANVDQSTPTIQITDNTDPRDVNFIPIGTSDINVAQPTPGSSTQTPSAANGSTGSLTIPDTSVINSRQVTSNNDNMTIQVSVPFDNTNTRSVSFQIPSNNAGPATGAQPENIHQRVPIPPGADETWKLTRKHLSASVKATARADHLTYLARNGLLPSWTIGAEALPGYIKPLITQLGDLRHMQAIECLNQMAEHLRLASNLSHQLGGAQRLVLRQLYGENNHDYQLASTRIDELVTRDQAECRTSLQRRGETLRSNPVSTQQVQDFLLQQHNVYGTPSSSPAPNQSAGFTPHPSTSGAGSTSLTDRTNQQGYQQRNPRQRGRGNSRSRGNLRGNRGRGMSNGRGRKPRSRSNSRNRSNSRSRRDVNNPSLTSDEQRVLQAYRDSK